MGREKYLNPSQTSLITIIVCLVEIVRTHRNKPNPVLCKVLEKPVKHISSLATGPFYYNPLALL